MPALCPAAVITVATPAVFRALQRSNPGPVPENAVVRMSYRSSTVNPNLIHVDVFADGPLTGNGLAVFLGTETWSAALMQRLTQEMKQFESIFLSDVSAAGATARVFTVDEELPFAGHPVLGAAAVLHGLDGASLPQRSWCLRLPAGPVQVNTWRSADHVVAEMNQGLASIGPSLALADLMPALHSLGLAPADLVPGLPAQVISTGLPYLILPVQAEALARTAITGRRLEQQLAVLGAKFMLVLDVAARELRTWDNLGLVEDVATGSAAGPAAAYLVAHGLANPAEILMLAQGRFASRASSIQVRCNTLGQWLIRGQVWTVAQGVLDPRIVHGLQRGER